MKKFIMAIALLAFVGGATIATANTTVVSDNIVTVENGETDKEKEKKKKKKKKKKAKKAKAQATTGCGAASSCCSKKKES